jgi:hypothetical protein
VIPAILLDLSVLFFFEFILDGGASHCQYSIIPVGIINSFSSCVMPEISDSFPFFGVGLEGHFIKMVDTARLGLRFARRVFLFLFFFFFFFFFLWAVRSSLMSRYEQTIYPDEHDDLGKYKIFI